MNVWEPLQAGQLRLSLDRSWRARPRGTASRRTNRTLASSSDDKTIRLWDLADGRCIATLEGIPTP